MDTGFQHMGFSSNLSNLSPNAFENLRRSKQVGPRYCADTVLRLDLPSIALPSTSTGIKRKWNAVEGFICPVDGSSLALGLGRTSSSSDSKGSSATACTTISSAKEAEEESSIDLGMDFNLHLSSEKNPSPKKSSRAISKGARLKFDLELSLSTGPAESGITTSATLGPTALQVDKDKPPFSPLVDEGSASSQWKLGNAVPPLQAFNMNETMFVSNPIPGKTDLVFIVPDSSTVVTMPKSSISTCEFTQMQQRSMNAKTCQFQGCGKGARGASGLCIAHGGGRRCQKAGCHKGAEGRTVYCKAHGGGRRCQYLGCTKSAEGRTDYCIAHGGGRRCSHDGCTRAARGKSGLCIRHGGGKRCQKENCTRSAEGLSGLCISHGGGRRCQFPECTKGAQGSTMYCKAHGGGKRCTALGCTKGAEGSTPYCKGHGGGKRCSFQGGGVCPKSVHGGTLFCVAHGGGKRCAMPDCTKSARGRTDFCVRHGGGKRCKSEGCGKSAQGSTDFCKAHGGGKRCLWGQSWSELGSEGVIPCERFARGKTGLCAAHSALVVDKQVHGGGTLGPTGHAQAEKVKEIEDMHVDVMKLGGELQGWNGLTCKTYGPPALSLRLPTPISMPIGNITAPAAAAGRGMVSLPEGRVHGGNLMAMLTGGGPGGCEKQAVVGMRPDWM